MADIGSTSFPQGIDELLLSVEFATVTDKPINHDEVVELLQQKCPQADVQFHPEFAGLDREVNVVNSLMQSNLPKDTINSIGMELRLIPAGKFQMGSPQTGSSFVPSEIQHDVELTRPFYIGTYEVTYGQFLQFTRESGYRTRDEAYDGTMGWDPNDKKWIVRMPEHTWRSPGFEQTDDHPVVNVSWKDAVEFCKWLSAKEGKSYRLPTEAEWEYACRAGTTTDFSYGDDPERLKEFGNVHMGATCPVGQFKANPFGLFDMHGNAEEWCHDWYQPEYYKSSPTRDPRSRAPVRREISCQA